MRVIKENGKTVYKCGVQNDYVPKRKRKKSPVKEIIKNEPPVDEAEVTFEEVDDGTGK